MSLADVVRATVASILKDLPGIEQRWGTVEEVGPVRVRMDGDDKAVPVSFIQLVPVAKGDRVSVHIADRARIITGVLGGRENTAVIAGGRYALSGSMEPPTFSFTNHAPVYAATVPLDAPYIAPDGWGFEVFCLSSSGYTTVSTVNQDRTRIVARIIQIGSSDTKALNAIGWRLTKI